MYCRYFQVLVSYTVNYRKILNRIKVISVSPESISDVFTNSAAEEFAYDVWIPVISKISTVNTVAYIHLDFIMHIGFLFKHCSHPDKQFFNLLSKQYVVTLSIAINAVYFYKNILF